MTEPQRAQEERIVSEPIKTVFVLHMVCGVLQTNHTIRAQVSAYGLSVRRRD